MRIEVNPGYEPHPHQVRFHESGARFLAASAGVRGGKTKAGAAEFTRRIAFDVAAGRGKAVVGIGRRRRPRLHYWLVAPTASLLKEPLRYLFESIPAPWVEQFYADDQSLWLRGDVLIECKTADNPLHLVSVGLNGLWIDEAARVKADAWRGQLRQRLSDHGGWALFTTTPLGRSWFYDDVVERSGVDGYDAVQWTTAQNPYIPADEIESARRELPDRYFRREYEGSFNAFSGTVYDEFSDSLHVLTLAQLDAEYPRRSNGLRSIFRRVIAGVDFGWNSPGAIVVVGDLGGQWVALEESYAPNRIVFDPRLTSGTWATEARRLMVAWGVSMFYCDPARPDAIFDLERAGIPVMGADNELVFGIRKVAEALHPINGKPRLRLVDGCKNLIREVRGYQFSPLRPQRQAVNVDPTLTFLEMPAPNQSDHACDALRYAQVELMRYEGAGEQRNGGMHKPQRRALPVM